MNENYDVSLPADYREPKWDEHNHVHNWRNYVSSEVRYLWGTFTGPQRAALARSFEQIACI